MESRPFWSQTNDNISICRTKRENNVVDTITLEQAILDLAYKGPGGNGEVEKRLKAGHTLENASFIYHLSKPKPSPCVADTPQGTVRQPESVTQVMTSRVPE